MVTQIIKSDETSHVQVPMHHHTYTSTTATTMHLNESCFVFTLDCISCHNNIINSWSNLRKNNKKKTSSMYAKKKSDNQCLGNGAFTYY